LDGDLDRPVRALADKGATGKTARAFFYAAIDRWVDMNSHSLSSLCLKFCDSKNDNRADRFSLVHEIESLVDLLQREHVGDHRIDLDLSVHVPVDDFRHIRAAARAAKSGALPDAAGHELERPRGDFLAGLRDPDNDRDAPAAVARFERLPHDGGVAG